MFSSLPVEFGWKLEPLVDHIPEWLIGNGILVIAAVVAAALHGASIRLLRRLAGPEQLYLQSLISRTRNITRLTLIVLFLSIALPMAFDVGDARRTLSQILLVLFTMLAGWAAVVAVGIGAELHLRKFRFDVEDNLLARKHVTQFRLLMRTANILIITITVAVALLSFESVREYGLSLLASAGVAGLVLGLAARPVLANMIAGLQIAITQPIRLDDAVVVENEWGWVEEINSTYVVIKLWDWRRLIVPLSYFIERPFQNWTRKTASIIGSVVIHADYAVPVSRVREKLEEIVKSTPLWDRDVVNLQVVEATERTIQMRVLVSARTSPQAWDLRCLVREQLVAFLQQEFPSSLPFLRHQWQQTEARAVWPDREALPEKGRNRGQATIDATRGGSV